MTDVRTEIEEETGLNLFEDKASAVGGFPHALLTMTNWRIGRPPPFPWTALPSTTTWYPPCLRFGNSAANALNNAPRSATN